MAASTKTPLTLSVDNYLANTNKGRVVIAGDPSRFDSEIAAEMHRYLETYPDRSLDMAHMAAQCYSVRLVVVMKPWGVGEYIARHFVGGQGQGPGVAYVGLSSLVAEMRRRAKEEDVLCIIRPSEKALIEEAQNLGLVLGSAEEQEAKAETARTALYGVVDEVLDKHIPQVVPKAKVLFGGRATYHFRQGARNEIRVMLRVFPKVLAQLQERQSFEQMPSEVSNIMRCRAEEMGYEVGSVSWFENKAGEMQWSLSIPTCDGKGCAVYIYDAGDEVLGAARRWKEMGSLGTNRVVICGDQTTYERVCLNHSDPDLELCDYGKPPYGSGAFKG